MRARNEERRRLVDEERERLDALQRVIDGE
jgi:hypothetical protein